MTLHRPFSAVLLLAALCLQGCHFDIILFPESLEVGPGQTSVITLKKIDGHGGGVRTADTPRFDVAFSVKDPDCGTVTPTVLKGVEPWKPVNQPVRFRARKGVQECKTKIVAEFRAGGHMLTRDATVRIR